MHLVIFLHGFKSSPNSFKAQHLAKLFEPFKSLLIWYCPALPLSPLDAIAFIENWVAIKIEEYNSADNLRVTLIGSSLGGYFATYLAERHGWQAVLLNPAILREINLESYIGETLYSYDKETLLIIQPKHLNEIKMLAVPFITRPQRYFLMAATGDEVINYQSMIQYYKNVNTYLIVGSNHGLHGFESHSAAILDFVISSQ